MSKSFFDWLIVYENGDTDMRSSPSFERLYFDLPRPDDIILIVKQGLSL